MLHPNDIDIFYEVVFEIYCLPVKDILASDLFFFHIKKDLAGEPLDTVNKLEKLFIENMDDFSVSKETFDLSKCYRFEGTK